MRKALSALVGLVLASTANAASIEYQGSKDGLNIVTFDGQIVDGDAAKFNQVTAQLAGPTVIVLTGPGGSVEPSLAIGATIRARGFATAVPDQTTCASACGLIWLAGKTRILSHNSRIGFHAAYRADGTESGAANALAGAYLNELGLPRSAIVFMTKSPPDGMTWLHPSDATQLGIAYALVEPSAPAPSSNFASDPVPVRPVQPSRTPTQQQALLTTSAYGQGRQARIEYEQWVNGLSNGDYKAGVLFWAAHRGDKPQPPACTEGSSAWQLGCQASRARLAPIDGRRVTEKDFWYGWNSL